MSGIDVDQVQPVLDLRTLKRVVSRKSRRLLPLGVVLALLCCPAWVGCGGGGASDAHQAAPDAHQAAPLRLPQDESAHDVPLEWWYYTGHLSAQNGDAWGFQVTFFKRQTGTDLCLANFAITDHQTKTFFFTEKVWFDAGATDRYSLNIAGWKASGANGYDTVSIDAGDNALQLDFSPLKPAVLHGVNGTIGSGADATHYYSRTRLDAVGTLTRNGQAQAVTGVAWMDHQWFDNPIELSYLKWDWFSLQLDGSEEIMLGILRSLADEPAEGTWVSPTGASTILNAKDFSVNALDQWTNPASGHTYPSGWTLKIPAHNLDVTILPVLLDQELYGMQYTPLNYWEGEVNISGTMDTQPVTGHGYVELTGYDH